MEPRIYQPSLLWAKAESWTRAQEPDRQLNPTDLQLVIYRADKPGGYTMHGPKLYWTDEPLSGQYFCNCDQSALADNADKLGEVVLYDRRFRRTHLLGKTYEEAWKKL
jgi:hypothetical protein